MADVRLDRAYRQRPGAPVAQNFADCGRLDWVAGACSRPMRLDEGDRIWIKAIRQIGPFKEGRLMRLRGQGDAGGAAVGIVVRPGNHRMDAIRAGASGAERAQDEDDSAFGTNVTIGFRGKCPAKTSWRQ